MTDVKHDLGLRAMKALNVALITASFAVCWYLYYSPRTYSPFFNKGNWAVIALFMLSYITYCKVYDALVISINRASEVISGRGRYPVCDHISFDKAFSASSATGSGISCSDYSCRSVDRRC